MVHNRFCCLIRPLIALMLFLAAGISLAASGGGTEKRATYFSQGQAIDNPQDRNASQQSAVQDFLVQALTQAMGTFLSPSQMASQFAFIQDKILKQPQHYVETYQVFSETPANGLYKVTGQVTVTMDLLRTDLEQMGIGAAEARTPLEAAVPSSTAPSAASAPSVQGRMPQGQRQPARGVVVTKQELFWAVTEKWDQQWYLPHGKRDPRGLFALSIMQEAQDFDWSLHLPEQGSITVEPNGNVSVPQVISEAKSLGISKIIVGTVGVRKKQNQDNSIEATLRVLNASTGKSQGEIRKTWKAGPASDQDDAVELASLVIAQLDNLLHEEGPGPGEDGEPAKAAPAAAAPTADSTRGSGGELRGTGEWTILIHSEHPFAHLEELQNLIKERSKSVQVKGMELGAAVVKLRLDGVDGQSLSSLRGARLPSGAQIQVDEVSQEARTISLSFSSTSTSQPEPGQ